MLHLQINHIMEKKKIGCEIHFILNVMMAIGNVVTASHN